MEAWQKGKCKPWSPWCVGWGERHELRWACATELGSVPAGMAATESGSAWAQVAPGCLRRDRGVQGALGLASLPLPCSRLSPGDANPNPGAVGERGFIFRDGKLGADFRRTQLWAVGTVLTVCNLSETPILTLESFFLIFYIQFLHFSALLEILFSNGIQLEFLV